MSAASPEPTRAARALKPGNTRRTKYSRWKRPIPQRYPRYDHVAGHTRERRRIEIYPKLDAIFVGLATLMSFAVAWIFLREGITTNPRRLVNLLVFWLVFTYVALPRIHQALTRIYVPDYFIGRTRTADGLLGDPVNLAFEGSENDIHVAMRKAGWILAEENTLHSARKMVTAFVFGRSYPQAPVSSLYLFDRRHDFAYQQEVGGTTVKRHHIRFWRAPHGWVLPGGHRVAWLGAATYDRSVGFSRFTWQITHKIDENTDVERDYVVDTLLYADPDLPIGVIKDYSASYHHRNGGGDPLRTDGHLPVVDASLSRERSTGSTAIMQARNRPVGVSFLKGRSLRPQLLMDTLQRNWHGAREDLMRLLDNAGDHHLPPPSILFTGAMILLQTGIAWFGMIQAGVMDSTDGSLSLLPWELHDSISVIFVITFALIVCFVLMIRRNRWARLAVMTLLAVDSSLRVSEAWLAPVGDLSPGKLFGVGLSALGLMALTSDAARIWVHTDRLRRQAWEALLLQDEPAAKRSGKSSGTDPS